MVAYQDISWASIQLWYLRCKTSQWSQSAEDGVQQHRQASRHSHHPLADRHNHQMTTARAHMAFIMKGIKVLNN